jgi:hypothetical protein
MKLKFPGLMQLGDYKSRAPDLFWEKFPKAPLPVRCHTPLNIEKLEDEVRGKMSYLSHQQILRARRLLHSLREGAPSLQKGALPCVVVDNASNTTKYGVQISDTVATWVVKGFAAGPFDQPPLKKFRSNSLLAVCNHVKVRPVLNVSLPEGLSFNSNIDDYRMEKVYMSSPRKFGYSIIEAGCGDIMSKFDSSDAYKNIPCPLEDLHLQGFRWLKKYFVETKQIFGARTAVPNYDILGNVFRNLVLLECDIPSKFVHRHLDDIPVVGPKNSGWCEEFTKKFRELTSKINLILAPDCPKLEKAFSNSQCGKVLGINFDTRKLSWELPEGKRSNCLRKIFDVLNAECINLKEFQEFMGCLNFVCMMSPFLNALREPLNIVLRTLHENGTGTLTKEARDDLMVFSAFLSDENSYHPIPPRPAHPPLAKKYLHLMQQDFTR